jgi:hypothetical protein
VSEEASATMNSRRADERAEWPIRDRAKRLVVSAAKSVSEEASARMKRGRADEFTSS